MLSLVGLGFHPPPEQPKTLSSFCLFVCLSVCLSVTLVNVRVCAHDFAMKTLQYKMILIRTKNRPIKLEKADKRYMEHNGMYSLYLGYDTYGNWTTRGYTNSRIANSRTGHLADWSTRALDNSRTSQLADWTSRGLDNSRSHRCR